MSAVCLSVGCYWHKHNNWHSVWHYVWRISRYWGGTLCRRQWPNSEHLPAEMSGFQVFQDDFRVEKDGLEQQCVGGWYVIASCMHVLGIVPILPRVLHALWSAIGNIMLSVCLSVCLVCLSLMVCNVYHDKHEYTWVSFQLNLKKQRFLCGIYYVI